MTNIVPMEKYRTAVVPTIVNGNQEAVVIQCLEAAKNALVQAKTVDEVNDTRHKVNALEALTKKFKLSKEIQLDATELRIRTERRLGEMLLVMDDGKKGGGKKSEGYKNQQSSQVSIDLTPTLSDLGISKNDSSKFQRLARTEKLDFESALTDLRVEAISSRISALSTSRLLKTVRDAERGDREVEFSPIIKPSDNWNFSAITYGRIDEELDQNWGYIPGELYANCFWYYVKPGNLVVAPMAGAGQVWRVYESRQEWMGQYAYDFDLKMFDLTPRGRYKDLIGANDLTKSFPIENPDYIVMDVPYYGMVDRQYSAKPEDLANMDLEEWERAMNAIATNCAKSQQVGTLCTVISPNYRDVVKGEIVMTTDIIRLLWEKAGYILYDKAYSSRRIQQAQNANIARMNNRAKANRIMLTDIAEILTFKRR